MKTRFFRRLTLLITPLLLCLVNVTQANAIEVSTKPRETGKI